MVEQHFKDSRALKGASTSASGPHLDGFSKWLQEIGYGPGSILTVLRMAVHVGLWCDRSRTSLGAFDEASIEQFRLHLRKCSCPGLPLRRNSRWTATHATLFLQYLRDHGIAAAAPVLCASPVHPLIAGFEAWMRQHRSVTPTTVRIYGRVVATAIAALGDDPAAFDVSGVRGFVLQQSRKHGRSQTKLVMTAMRVFLRYLIACGACQPGLDDAVPTIAGWRLASLPRYLCSADLERVIASCDPTSTSGIRNRAMLLLMARLGLRAGDVAALRLEDLDWQRATLSVSGKSRRTMRLPLPQEVGDAVLAYLPLRLPKDSDRVFLRLRPPRGPITSDGVSTVASTAMRVAGVVAPVRGAHVFRHSAATELLRQGASLDQVRHVLRHRDPETTRLYAKVDVASLRRIAQPWPEVTPC